MSAASAEGAPASLNQTATFTAAIPAGGTGLGADAGVWGRPRAARAGPLRSPLSLVPLEYREPVYRTIHSIHQNDFQCAREHKGAPDVLAMPGYSAIMQPYAWLAGYSH